MAAPLVGSRQIVIIAACLLFGGASLVFAILTGLPLLYLLAVVLAAAVVILYTQREMLMQPAIRGRAMTGFLGGLFGLIGYDLTRALVVSTGLSRIWGFDALQLFGELLVGANAPWLLIWGAGIGFHAINGLSFGAAYGIMAFGKPWWYGIGWALVLEAFMVTLYPGWLHVAAVGEFTSLTLLGHLVYGTVLGSTVATRSRYAGEF